MTTKRTFKRCKGPWLHPSTPSSASTQVMNRVDHHTPDRAFFVVREQHARGFAVTGHQAQPMG